MIRRIQRIGGRVKKRMSKVVLGVLGAVGLAGGLAALDSFLAARPLLAVAALLATGSAAWFVWKIHAISLGIRDLRRRPALSSATAAAPAAPAPVQPQPVGVTEKLRTIGEFHPERAQGASAGRQAAAVSTDPDAAFRLYAATQRTSGSPRVGRSLGVVGTDALVQKLAMHGTVQRLHPSLSAAEMAKSQPDVLIVEEDALVGGPWRGALESHGGKLLLELRVAMATMRRLQRPIYVIAATGIPGLAAAGLRADTILVDDAYADEVLRPDAPPSLLATMAGHRRQAVAE